MLIFKLPPGGLGWVGACKWPDGLVVWGPGGRPWVFCWSSRGWSRWWPNRGWSRWWPSRGWSRCWPSWGLEPDSWLLTATSTSPRVPDLPGVDLLIFYPHFWLFLCTIGDFLCALLLIILAYYWLMLILLHTFIDNSCALLVIIVANFILLSSQCSRKKKILQCLVSQRTCTRCRQIVV